MSQLRQEILDEANKFLVKIGVISIHEPIDDNTQYPLNNFDPETEGRFIIYLEDKWGVRFERIGELRETQSLEPGFEVDTVGDLITIVIKLMNDVERY